MSSAVNLILTGIGTMQVYKWITHSPIIVTGHCICERRISHTFIYSSIIAHNMSKT